MVYEQSSGGTYRYFQTIQESDGLGRLISVKDYLGAVGTNPGAACPQPAWTATPDGVTTYTYDVADRLTKVTGPDNAAIEVEYDLAGRKTKVKDPNMGEWTYAYDAASNLTRQTDAWKQTICFYHDALNRPTGKHYRTDTNCPTNTPSLNVEYKCDQGTNGKGRRTGMTDPSGNTSWEYDTRGRVTKETKVINAPAGGTFVTQWGYDALNRVVTMTYPGDNEAVTFTYNAQGLLKTVSGSNTYYVGDTVYNARGQVELRRLGSTSGVLTTDYIYRTDNFRLQWIKTGPTSPYEGLQNLEYAYDAAGNVLTIKDYNAGGTQTQSFSYDALHRLKTAQASGGSGGAYGPESYAYTANGNLTSKTGIGNYKYNASVSGCSAGTAATKPHAVATAGSYAFTYDCNGNVVQRNVGASYTLTYDAENRLTSVSGGAAASFVYDGDGRRVKATINGVTTVYIGDYYEQAGSTIRKYYYADGQRVAIRENSTLYYLLTDHLGSTAVTANASGGKYGELRYKAWGETRYTWGTTPTTSHGALQASGKRVQSGCTFTTRDTSTLS